MGLGQFNHMVLERGELSRCEQRRKGPRAEEGRSPWRLGKARTRLHTELAEGHSPDL